MISADSFFSHSYCNTSKVLNMEFSFTISNVTTMCNMAQHKYVVTIYTGTPCLTRLKSTYMHQLQTEQCWWALMHSLRQISITEPLKTKHASQQEVPPAHPEGEQTKYNLSSNSSMGCYVDVLILQRQMWLFSETESQQLSQCCTFYPSLLHFLYRESFPFLIFLSVWINGIQRVRLPTNKGTTQRPCFTECIDHCPHKIHNMP